MDNFFLSEDEDAAANIYRNLDLDDWTSPLRLDLKPSDISLSCPAFVDQGTSLDKTEFLKEAFKEKESPVDWFKFLDNFGKEKLLGSLEQKSLMEQVVPEPSKAMEVDEKTLTRNELASSTITEQGNLMVLTTGIKEETTEENEDQNEMIVCGDNEKQVENNLENKRDSLKKLPAGENLDNLCLPDTHDLIQDSLKEGLNDHENLQGETENGINLSSDRTSLFDKELLRDRASGSEQESYNEHDTMIETSMEALDSITSEDENSNYEDDFCIDQERLFRKIVKILTPKTIPKCKMISYDFHREQLPSFKDVFYHSSSGNILLSGRQADLPEVLLPGNDKMMDDVYLLLDESSSEDETEECLTTEIMEERQIKREDKPIERLCLDDDLETFLVSNMSLDQSNSTSHLPDLSNNLGSFLKHDISMDEDIGSLDAIYPSIFPRTITGMQMETQDWEVKIPKQHPEGLYDSLLYNENLQRIQGSSQCHSWQRNNEFVSKYSGNESNPSQTHEDNMYRTHFTNLHPDMKLCKKETHSNFSDLKLNVAPATKVEVLDSSLNYGF